MSQILFGQAEVCCESCNPNKWEAEFWGWLEVWRPALLHVSQWIKVQTELADSMVTLGEPRDWLGVGKRVHWALDTSNSSKHSWQAVVGQKGSIGGSAEWVTRPVTFLWIYNFCLKYEKGMSGFFLGFFSPVLERRLFFSTFWPLFLPLPTHSFFLFLSIYPSCLPWSTTWKNVNAHFEGKRFNIL